MGNYLKKFENHTQYDNIINGSNVILPNVSLCVQENEVHYNPWVETRLVAKHNVTDTSSSMKIINSYNLNQFSAIEIDGVEQSEVTDSYNFSTTGEHTVKYTLIDPTIIDNSAFASCSGLTSIDIPNGVTRIGSAAFADCIGLTSIFIPNSVTSIGEETFYGCTSLTTIDIPNSITNIGTYVFDGCSALTSVTVKATQPPTLGSNAFNNTNITAIYVPSANVETYKSASGWSNYADRIQAIS